MFIIVWRTFGIDYSKIEHLGNKDYFAELMFDENYAFPGTPADSWTASDYDKAQDAVKELRLDIRENLSMAQYFDIETIDDAKEWFTLAFDRLIEISKESGK